MRWMLWFTTAGLLMTAAVGAEPDAAPAPPASAYEQGVRAAEAEWRKGDVTFYTRGGGPGGLCVDLKTGIPHRILASCITSPEIQERMRGHNERVLQLIDQRGLPPGNKRAWLPQILAPIKYWRSQERLPLVLRLGQGEVVSPEGGVRLRLGPAPPYPGPRLLVTRNGEQIALSISAQEGEDAEVEVQWGPAKSDLLFVRETPAALRGLELFCAFDTRTGRLLNLALVLPSKGQP